jgi:hypothetical protein
MIVNITKNKFQTRKDEPNRVFHSYEGTIGDYTFTAETDSNGSDGINKGSIYQLDIWKSNGNSSIARYDRKWDYRTKNPKEGKIRSAIINYIDSISSKKDGEPKRLSKGGNVTERRYVNKEEDYEIRYAKDKPMRKGYNNTRKFAVGGEVGNQVNFRGDYGKKRSGIITGKKNGGYTVSTDDGNVFVESYEIDSFEEAPVAKKKRFGFFEGGGEIEGKISDLKSIVDDESMPEFAREKARETIAKLEKELHESKETKAEEKAEHKNPKAKTTKSIVEEIDMDEINRLSIYNTDDSKWDPKPTVSKFEKELEEYKLMKRKFDDKRIPPSKIIGRGYEPKFARPLAEKWLKEQILIAEKSIEILKERGGEKTYTELTHSYDTIKVSKGKEHPVSIWIDEKGKEYVTGQKHGEKVIKTENTLLSGFNELTATEKAKFKTPAKPKPSHKKLVAKLKAKKGEGNNNRASLIPFTETRRKRNESSDKKREALPLGKRVSASGITYWENCLNRGDISKEDKFEGGGEIGKNTSGWGLKFLNW